MFRAIASDNFPPFENLRLELPPVENKPADLAEVHLFTGANGTGKTRLLSLLAAMLGNSEALQKRLKGMEGESRILSMDQSPIPGTPQQWAGQCLATEGKFTWETIGGIRSWVGQVPAFAYSGVAYVSDTPIAIMAETPKPERLYYLSFIRPENHSAVLLQAIANLKVQVAMDSLDNEVSGGANHTRSTRIVRALESTISAITSQKFAFQMTTYPKAALGVNWGGVKLAFDVLPDGLRSIIGWMAHAVVMMDVWLQGNGDPMETEAVFLLDEIESSLHPAWQRRILPAFQRLFPKAQMFIATHSPFLIASLNHGWIHPLNLMSNGKVKAADPIAASEGDSYISVVEDIMGVNEWYDTETEGLLAEFRENRDAAYHGNQEAKNAAQQLAAKIGARSMELHYMMGQELSQMDRQLAKSTFAK